MKFYFVELIHRKTGITLHKFGVTHHYEVLDRFSHIKDQRWAEFSIRVLFSIYFENEEDALLLEQNYLQKYPKNFNLEVLLKVDSNYYDNLSGITETVLLSDVQRYNILQNLFYIKREYNKIKKK